MMYPIVVIKDNVNIRALGKVHLSSTEDPSYPLLTSITVSCWKPVMVTSICLSHNLVWKYFHTVDCRELK